MPRRTQRDVMRELYRRHGGARARTIDSYAAAERAGVVTRGRNASDYTPKRYATALFSDGIKKGWLTEEVGLLGEAEERPFRTKTTRELLTIFSQVMQELRQRGAVRSANNPVADYAESIVSLALGLTLMPGSHRGCDATDSTGKRYEIKGRRITRHNTSTQMGVVRGLENSHFDYLAGVLFDEDFNVSKACLIPHSQVSKLARHRKHINGWILFLRPSVWDQPGVVDITTKVQRAQAKA